MITADTGEISVEAVVWDAATVENNGYGFAPCSRWLT